MKISMEQFRKICNLIENSQPNMSGRLLVSLIGAFENVSERAKDDILNGFEDISVLIQMLEMFEFEKYFDSELLIKQICYIFCEFDDVLNEISSFLIATFHVLRKVASTTDN